MQAEYSQEILEDIASIVPKKEAETAFKVLQEEYTKLTIKLKEAQADIASNEDLFEQMWMRAEERYRSIYTMIPAILYSIDEMGKLFTVSNLWVNTLGYSREEVIGRKILDFMTPASARLAKFTIIPKYMKIGVVENLTYQFVSKKRKIKHFQLSSVAEKNKDGKYIRAVAVCVDISDRIKLNQSLEQTKKQLKRIYENIPTVTICLEYQFPILHSSEYFLAITNYKKEELLGKPFMKILTESSLTRLQDDLILPLQSKIEERRETTLHIKYKNGAVIPTQVCAYLVNKEVNLVFSNLSKG